MLFHNTKVKIEFIKHKHIFYNLTCGIDSGLKIRDCLLSLNNLMKDRNLLFKIITNQGDILYD